ncbi:hypothetical protein PV327_007663 [Microctonus hyperodae]|uniref:Transcription initiation factor TFIID subunit 6 n=1 Tax=Microctonus hyperodae TaxID=165561 RepID=A0AA39FZN7_MICHY|nr:hypothetical protein PV327_007663 [Microctonus hyperodae]
MKELMSAQQTNLGFTNNFTTNNGNTSTSNNVTNGNSQRRYAVLSTEWISAIGEELGIHPLPDSLLKRLAEDASYRLREVLHKCVTRLNHSRKQKLTSSDVNSVITKLSDAEPIFGASNHMPSYHNEAQVFVPHEDIIDVTAKATNNVNISQISGPYLVETEVFDSKLIESRHTYAKKALKILFNGSQKTFQVLLNDCATNPQLESEGIIDTLISTARSTVISNNAQYTRVTTRTCQLIIAIASNDEAVYPYHLNSVEKLTELLLELLLGQSFINPFVESLFRTCALKLMLRWPSVVDKFVPMLKDVLLKDEKDNSVAIKKKRMTAMELLAGVQPLVYFQEKPGTPLSLANILPSAKSGSTFWQQIALAICALVKSNQQEPDRQLIMEHFGDAILPYLATRKLDEDNNEKEKFRTFTALPIIVRSKIKYANIQTNSKFVDRQTAFPDSVLRGPRREIRFAFAGGRPVAPNNLRRVNLRASYQILRSDTRATNAHIASHRLLILKDKKPNFRNLYSLSDINL